MSLSISKLSEYMDICEQLSREREALTAENARLREIVERLPKTKDGKPVVPGVDRVWTYMGDAEKGRAVSCCVEPCGPIQAIGMDPEDGCGYSGHVSHFYSTREAAEAAEAAGGAE